MLPARELDRRGWPLRRHVPRGHVRRGGGPRSSVLQDQARLGRDRAARVQAAVPHLSPRVRRRPLEDRRDRQDRRPVLLLQDAAEAARHGAQVDADDRHRGRAHQHRAGGLRRRRPRLPRAQEGPRRQVLPPDRSAAAPDRRGAQHLRARRARAADDDARQREDVRLHPGAGALRHRLARADQARDPRRADRPRHPARRVPVRQLADSLRQPRRGQGAQGLGHRGAAARDVRGEALGLLGEEPRSGSLHRPLARRPRQGQGDRRHRLLVGHRQGDGAQARRSGRQGDSRRSRRGEAPRDEGRDRPPGRQGVDLHRRHRRTSPPATRSSRAC